MMKSAIFKLVVGIMSVLFCVHLNAQFYPVRERMLTTSLNGTWKIKIIQGRQLPDTLDQWTKPDFNATGWDDVTVPSNWETQGLKKPEYGKDLGDYTGLYRRAFDYNPIWKNRHVIVRFDGVHFAYTVYVNGQEVGNWGSAFNMHQFDITRFLVKNEKNILCVKVSTRSLSTQPPGTWQFDTNDDWSLSGISRDVTVFSLDNIYIKDIKFNSTVLKNKDANVSIDAKVGTFNGDSNVSGYTLQASLVDNLEHHLMDFRQEFSRHNDSLHFEGELASPRLWTVETPNLYRLEVSIVGPDGKVIQRANQRVGIRSVKVEGFRLEVNNMPVKLHGVCLSEIDPKLGRALTYKARRRQLSMMKAAGINFIRTAHYPFGPDFYTLCDEMGFYVCDEVPFGFGDKNLSDEAYLPELITRAKATIGRDKNHPSVIIWSIGNENPYTPIVEKVIQYVKETDPGRPRGLPQRGSDYLRYQGKQSPNVDVYMPHYLDVKRLNESLKKTDKPLILTEYAHSLGLAMDEFEEQYENIVRQAKIIGGSVWCWTDQAILTNSVAKFQKKANQPAHGSDNTMPPFSGVEQGIQIDQNHYLDNSGNNGADGIVYGDGYPQEDYFLVRKLYTPVQILTDTLKGQLGGGNRFDITLANRFDFISLVGYQLRWQLVYQNKALEQGDQWLDITAHNKDTISIKAKLPAKAPSGDIALHLQIIDPNGHQINEKNIVLRKANFLGQVQAGNAGRGLFVSVSKTGILTAQSGQKMLLHSPLLMRVGRKLTITLESQTLKDKFNWTPYLLKPVVDKCHRQKTDSGLLYTLDCHWRSQTTKTSHRGIRGRVQILVRKNNVIEMAYNVHPDQSATGNLLECGLTLVLDSAYRTFHWLGKGLFSTSVGKSAYNEHGVWALDIDDIRFNGNRAAVELAEATSLDSCGLGFWSSNGNIGIENIRGRMAVSQNGIVTGYGSKFKAPKGRKPVSEIQNISGKFILFTNTPAHPAKVLNTVFDPYSIVNPERPYLDSYGW
ncbi:glycoside hydrolase family 2 protein [Arachidicoccus terrestris]|uniref:glycoside hydrolase family 2 protein n=1 Tax=Arachidicoccus terrestris TaxID=2875539 RepID=UPI001CC35B47|nr:glycoside hydrolase family 2 TIM barrel-domain containing protein [Arachidicoccus terrestris]UAY53818.1 hypothetical protein K9M52_10010 [Arachidicoccus terrestris]